MKRSDIRPLIFATLLGFLAWFGLSYVAEHAGWNADIRQQGGSPRIELDLVMPLDLDVQFHYIPKHKGGRSAPEKFKKKNSIAKQLVGSTEPQVVSFPLPKGKTLESFRITFGKAEIDTAGRSQLSPQEIKARRQPAAIRGISLLNGEQKVTWKGKGIEEGFELSRTLKRHRVKNGEFTFSLKRRKSTLTTKGALEIAVAESPETSVQGSWIYTLLALLLGGLVFWLVFRFRARYESASSYSLAIIIIFLLLTIIPHFDLDYSARNFPENNEKRKLAPKPEFTWDDWQDYPDDYERYYKDQFGFRKPLIYANSLLKVKGLGVSPFPTEVILGKENWLFKAEFLPDYQGRMPYTEKELKGIATKFLNIQQRCADRGIKYYLFLNPDKYTIYPEYLPNWVHKVNEQRRLDQLTEYIQKNHPELRLIDARPELLAAKADERTYNMHDLHWNDYGAFIAYQKLISEIGKDFPGMKPLQVSDYDLKKKLVFKGGLSKMLSIQEHFHEERIALKPKYESDAVRTKKLKGYPPLTILFEQKGKELPKALVFRDSFFTGIIPHFSEHFSRALYIKNANRKKIKNLDQKFLEKEKPDILVHQMAQFSSLSLEDY